MKLKNTSVCLLAGWMLAACSGSGFQKTGNGVVVEVGQQCPTDVRKVRLEVMGEKLIRVSATPEKEFSKEQSLIVIPQQGKTDFRVEEQGDEVAVKTAELCAIVSKTTGEVRFTDAEGKQILAEERDGRTFTPVEVEGTKGYSVRQVFRSAGEDEAFYGLGQHQADEFNYKGKNEELFQYNTKVSVPFIVSNKHYGVLWDSYSLCRFGDPRSYSQLGSVFKLYDKEGKEGALTGTYTPAKKEVETIVRREDSLYFEHLDRAAHLNKVINLPDGFPFMGSHVAYEGEIEPAESGLFRFRSEEHTSELQSRI